MVLGNFFPDMNNEASRIVLGNIFAIVSMSFDRRREKGTEGKRMKILGNKDRIFQDLKMEPLDNFCCGYLLATNERRERRKTRMKIFGNKGRIFQDLTMETLGLSWIIFVVVVFWHQMREGKRGEQERKFRK